MELVPGINTDVHSNRFLEWKVGFENRLLTLPNLLREESQEGQLRIEDSPAGEAGETSSESGDIEEVDAELTDNVAIKIEVEEGFRCSQNSSNDIDLIFHETPQSPRPGPSNATFFSAPASHGDRLEAETSKASQEKSKESNSSDASPKSSSLLALALEDEPGILGQLISHLNRLASIQAFSKELGNKLLETKELEAKWNSKYNTVLSYTRANFGNRFTDVVQKNFQNYAQILRCQVIAYNEARQCRFNIATDIFNGRFKVIEDDFGDHWLEKTLADIEALYVNDHLCELKLLDYFDSDWKDFYYDLKRRRVQCLFKLVDMVKKYREKMVELCTTNICCLDDPTLSNYHNEATRVALGQPGEFDQPLLEKAKLIVQNVRVSLQKSNDLAIQNESAIARRAVLHAQAAYCRTFENKLKRPLRLRVLKAVHQTAKNFIEENFFGVPEFLYTEPWQHIRNFLQDTLESEFHEIQRRNEASKKLQQAHLASAIEGQVSAFRRKVMIYLGSNPDAEVYGLEHLVATELPSAVRAVTNVMMSNDDRTQIEAQLSALFQARVHQLRTKPGPAPLPGLTATPVDMPSSLPFHRSPSPCAPSIAGSTRSAEFIFSEPDTEMSANVEIIIHESGIGLFFHVDNASIIFKVDGENIVYTKSLTIELKQTNEEFPVYVTHASEDEDDISSLDIYDALINPESKKTEEKFFMGTKKVQLWSEELLAIFLHQLKSEVEARWKKDISADYIAIALPTCVQSNCKQRLKSALRLAGMTKSIFVQPTTAIGMYYLSHLPPEESPGQYVLAVYMESLVLDVALFRVQNGKVKAVAIEGSSQFPELREQNSQEITRHIREAVSSVIKVPRIQPEDIQHCTCSVYHPKLFKEPASDASSNIQAMLNDAFSNILPRRTKFNLTSIQDEFLQGLFQVSKNLHSPSPDLYQEVFPVNIEIKNLNRVPGNQLNFVLKNENAVEKSIQLLVHNIGSHEEPSSIVTSVDNESIKLMHLSLNENVKRNHGNCQVLVTISKEGIITATPRSKSGKTPKQIKIRVASSNMNILWMNQAKSRVQNIIKASEALVNQQQCRSTTEEPPIKRRRETQCNI